MKRAFGIKGELRINFVDGAVTDILRSVSGPIGLKSKTGAFMLTLALIDFVLPPGSSGEQYALWVNENMKRDYEGYEGEIIWALRCQYIHNYGPNAPQYYTYRVQTADSFIAEGDKDPHMKRGDEDRICIDIPRFVADVIYSVMRYLPKVDESLLMEKSFIIGMNPNRTFEEIHPYLREFDKSEPSHDQFIKDIKALFSTPIQIENYWVETIRKNLEKPKLQNQF